jgi:ubiquinone/menaquinone biosynthesis C-methylase UbiE
MIVDVGCGPGILLHCLEAWFPTSEIVGVDSSDQLLELARSHCRKATLMKGDACALPLKDESAEVLFALHVVEHLDRPVGFFAEALRVLVPGGLLVIATPNAEGLGAKLRKDKWSGYKDPTHIALKGSNCWRNLVRSSGFTIIRDGTTGLAGIPWFNKMPLGLIHWVPTFLFGYFPWSLGEAYICTAVKEAK